MVRNITAEDVDFIYRLYMHPQVNPWLLYEQMDQQAFLPVYNELLSKNIIYIFNEDGADRGMFKFIQQQHRNAHTAYLGGVAIDPLFARQGYAVKMMEEIIDLGRMTGIKRIELSTAMINEKAIRLYEKVGFEKEGVLKKYTWLKSENRYLDELMMSYIY
jgi:putative acetyltransferase